MKNNNNTILITLCSGPLNNNSLYCAGPLRHGAFSVIRTTVLIFQGWLNPQMQNHRYGGLTVKLYADFQVQGVWCPTPVLFKDQVHFNKSYVNLSLSLSLSDRHCGYNFCSLRV